MDQYVLPAFMPASYSNHSPLWYKSITRSQPWSLKSVYLHVLLSSNNTKNPGNMSLPGLPEPTLTHVDPFNILYRAAIYSASPRH